MHKIVFLRHGQSIWNMENRFTGWVDVALSDKGKQEAKKAGLALKEAGFDFDISFSSYLKRAIKTLWIVLEEMDLSWLPVNLTWQLNERHYGALQGLNKAETIKKYGEEQVHLWRRSFAIAPPLINEASPYYPKRDARYTKKNTTDLTSNSSYEIADKLPLGESLKDTTARVIPFWKNNIVPQIKANKSVLLVAHGNSLRALIKTIDKISDDEISELNIPTGTPLIYELDAKLQTIKHYYL